jgi:hypothetical protein
MLNLEFHCFFFVFFSFLARLDGIHSIVLVRLSFIVLFFFCRESLAKEKGK